MIEKDMVNVHQTNRAYGECKPWWEPEKLAMTEFCNNDKTLPLKITVFNYSNNGP